MYYNLLLISVITVGFNYSTSSDVQTGDVSLNDHVKKIDEMLAEMQSHSKAEEQKNRAMFTSLLSQLTHTKDELRGLEKSHNETLLQLEKKDAELSHLRSKLEDLEKRPNPNGNIGFHGTVSNGMNVTAGKPIMFSRILYDIGANYKENTGKFHVPINGTYQIWIDIKYRRPSAVVFKIQKGNHVIGQAYGSTMDATTSLITMSYLQRGQSIWVAPSQTVYLDNSFCSFGTVLLNAH